MWFPHKFRRMAQIGFWFQILIELFLSFAYIYIYREREREREIQVTPSVTSQ